MIAWIPAFTENSFERGLDIRASEHIRCDMYAS